jgi:hypothetical protein
MASILPRLGCRAALLGLGLALLGCERSDPRVAALTAGIAKDSVMAIMGSQPQRNDPYLVQGQYIEAMYFPRGDAAGPEATVDRNMTPVVLINSMLAGWGWAYWDSAAAANGISVAARQ